MAINFVRQPSETPNVRNIDDIIPFRYAYGNQNGYVKDKGNELSYTLNGSNFRINSGRVVLQGVESDIDANGVTITVDNVATTRYYSIYYRVNLATNTTSIESEFSTTDYPEIDPGDDLTANTSGSANLELYRFTALNGIITNVTKVVKEIGYVNIDTKVKNSAQSDNALSINNLQLQRDNNGVLKIGDVIIPQKYVIWDQEITCNAGSSYKSIILSENLKQGDIIEIEASIGDLSAYSGTGRSRQKIILPQYNETSIYGMTEFSQIISVTANRPKIAGFQIHFYRANTLRFGLGFIGAGTAEGSSTPNTTADCTIYKIYKVIE